MKYSSPRARCVALCASFAIATLLIAFEPAPAEAIVYHGTPDLPLLASAVVAGGGPEHFSSVTLLTALAGPHAPAEVQKLTRQFGKREVENALAVFDYAVADALRVATSQGVALPKPAPAPADARKLALALYRAGLTPHEHWDVGYMLEHLMSHPIHHVIMKDMDAKFGPANNGRFHIVLAQMMDDLAEIYAQSN